MRINKSNNPEEIWQNFRSLTSYQDENSGGVLPYKDSEQNAVCNSADKCKVLQDVFFGGRHLEKEEFDETTRVEVENKVKGIREQTNPQESDETYYLNHDITEEETEAVLQSLQKGKAPGNDLVYTDLLLASGQELRKAIHYLFHKS